MPQLVPSKVDNLPEPEIEKEEEDVGKSEAVVEIPSFENECDGALTLNQNATHTDTLKYSASTMPVKIGNWSSFFNFDLEG